MYVSHESVNQLPEILAKNPMSINNFSQSTQSVDGPKHRDTQPGKTSLMFGILEEIQRRKLSLQRASEVVQQTQNESQTLTLVALGLVVNKHAASLTDKECVALMGTTPLAPQLHVYVVHVM